MQKTRPAKTELQAIANGVPEKEYLEQMFWRHGSNIAEAAQACGVSVKTFHRRCEKYNVKLPAGRQAKTELQAGQQRISERDYLIKMRAENDNTAVAAEKCGISRSAFQYRLRENEIQTHPGRQAKTEIQAAQNGMHEMEYLYKMLREHQYNVKKTAEACEVSERALRNRLKLLKIERKMADSR